MQIYKKVNAEANENRVFKLVYAVLSPVFHKYSEIILLLSILYKKKALEYIRFVRDLFSFKLCLVV